MIRVVKFYWPVLIVLIPNLGFAVYLAAIQDNECQFILGQSTALLAMYQFSYALPGLILISSFYTFLFGINGLRQGKYPPDGFPVFARKPFFGSIAKLINITGILLPLFAVYLIFLGIEAVDSISSGKTYVEINRELLKQC